MKEFHGNDARGGAPCTTTDEHVIVLRPANTIHTAKGVTPHREILLRALIRLKARIGDARRQIHMHRHHHAFVDQEGGAVAMDGVVATLGDNLVPAPPVTAHVGFGTGRTTGKSTGINQVAKQ